MAKAFHSSQNAPNTKRNNLCFSRLIRTIYLDLIWKKSFSICYLWLGNSFYVVIYYSYLIIHNSGLWKVNYTIEYRYLQRNKPFTLFCNSIKNSDIKVIFHSDKVRMHQFCPPTTSEKLVLNGMYVRNAYLLSFKILFHPLKCM